MQDTLFEAPVQEEPAAETKKEEKQDAVPRPMVDAALGMSRKWDARQAGREVAETAIQKLKGPPSFFLLFSTIHYEKYGGFQELLNGVWDVLPKGTPLIGGTVAGFMNNFGCYTRGTSALAVSHPDIDVVVGLGKNAKRNPKKAARQSTEMILKGLEKSLYKNKFLLNLVSGPETPSIPGLGRKKIIRSGFVSKFAMQAIGMSQVLFQKGLGREDEVFEEIVKQIPDYHMILGTTLDDYKGISNYQFYNTELLTNSVVNLSFTTDLDLNVFTTHGMKKTNITFDITKLSKNRHIIHEINHKPAVPELLNLLHWPEDFLDDKTMLKTIPYYPMSLQRNNREVPVVMPLILKNSILMPCLIDDGEVSILTVSGENLVNAAKENLHFFNNIDPEFGIISSCVTILETLGYKMYKIRECMLNYFGEKPFLLFWCAGEGTYTKEKNITYANMSFNTAVVGQKK